MAFVVALYGQMFLIFAKRRTGVVLIVGVLLALLLRSTILATCSAIKDVSVADELAKRIKIMCIVLTTPSQHYTHAVHIRATWGKRCTKLLFISEKNDSTLPVLYVNVSTGRQFLAKKMRMAWDMVYRYHIDEADWFLKADCDTFVIMENLRYFLSSKSPEDPVYYGHHFKVIVKPNGFFSGGGGYVLSKEALRRFGTRPSGTYREDPPYADGEDVEIGWTLQTLNVTTGDSRDYNGLTTFHNGQPEQYLVGPIPKMWISYDKYPPKWGIKNVSRLAISFHRMTVQHIYIMEYCLYRLKPYGLREHQRT